MASDRLATVLRARGCLSEEEIASMSEDEAWQWLRSNPVVPHQDDDESCPPDDC